MITPEQGVPKQAVPGTGQMVVSEADWNAHVNGWETRLSNQREVIDNLDRARLEVIKKHHALLARLDAVTVDLDQVIPAETEDRVKTNLRVIRDTLQDLVRAYR